MHKNLTVTIGISAYNEAHTINHLLQSLLLQKRRNFTLEKIVVVSDGSTDNTVEEIRKIHKKKIILVVGQERQGKIKRLNYIFKYTKSDLLVLLDADIIMAHKSVIEELVKSFIKQINTAVVFGRHKVIPSDNYFDLITAFGVNTWEHAVNSLGKHGLEYRAVRRIRALHKSFYSKFLIPKYVTQGEDNYNFFYAIANNFSVSYAPKALVYYKNPTNIKEYIRQMSRFITSSDQNRKRVLLPDDHKFGKITYRIRLVSMLKLAKKTPLYIVIGYLCLQTAAQVYAQYFYKPKSIWDISASSKEF